MKKFQCPKCGFSGETSQTYLTCPECRNVFHFEERKELWLVVMVGVYDHGVHFVAESEEQAIQFTNDYAPDHDGYHSWDIRKMAVGTPSDEVIKKNGPVWTMMELINRQMSQIGVGSQAWRHPDWKQLTAAKSHLIRHMLNKEVVCNCEDFRFRDFRWENVRGSIRSIDEKFVQLKLDLTYRGEFITSTYRLPKADYRDGPYWVLDTMIGRVEDLMDEVDKLKEKQ